MIGVFNSNKSACYRCLFPEVPKVDKLNCSQGGVLGVTPGMIGLWQATEVIKLIIQFVHLLKFNKISKVNFNFYVFGFERFEA